MTPVVATNSDTTNQHQANGAAAPPVVEQPKVEATAQPQATNSTAIVPASQSGSDTISAFASEANFNAGQRMARALASSSLVPKQYQGQANIPNVLIAMELASRIGASVLMIMQNLDIIQGRPSWRSQFLIATVNSSGKFTPIRFRWSGKEGTDSWGCRAIAKDKDTGEECIGTLITMAMAKAEGWATKSGSKWTTMPELMMQYRAAAFWTRIYAPELSLGMQTREEAIDTTGVEVTGDAPQIVSNDPKALEAALFGQTVTVDGEIVDSKPEGAA